MAIRDNLGRGKWFTPHLTGDQRANEIVAGVGMACLTQDKKSLKEMGIPAKNKKRGVWTHRVVILVENTEHAQTLGDNAAFRAEPDGR